MKNKQIIVGSFLNYAVLIMQVVSTIAITPFIISSIGDGTYGVYKIVSSLIAYMGILNFGFGNATIKFLTEIKMKNDIEKEKEFLSVIKLWNLIAALIAVIVGIILYYIIPIAFANSLTTGEISVAQQMFIVLIASVIVNIFNDIYLAVITVHERFVFSKGLDLARCILRIVLIFLILSMHPSAVLLVVIDLAMSLFAFACNVIFCRGKLHTHPKYSLMTLKTMDKAYYKPVLIYAMFFFLNLITDQLLWNTDSIIIGMRLSAFDAGVYGTGSTISSGFYSLSLVIGTLLFPRIIRIVNSDASKQKWTDIMIVVGRTQAFIALFVFTLYFACGRQFVEMWVGPKYAAAWTTSIIVMAGTLFNSIMSAGHLILRALNRQKFILGVYLGIFATNAVVSYMVVVKYGIVGAALVTFLSFFVGVAFFILPYLHNKIGLNIISFIKNLIFPLGMSAGLGILFFFLFSKMQINSVNKLLFAAVIYTIVYYMTTYLFVLKKGEKQVIKDVIAQICSKFRRAD